MARRGYVSTDGLPVISECMGVKIYYSAEACAFIAHVPIAPGSEYTNKTSRKTQRDLEKFIKTTLSPQEQVKAFIFSYYGGETTEVEYVGVDEGYHQIIEQDGSIKRRRRCSSPIYQYDAKAIKALAQLVKDKEKAEADFEKRKETILAKCVDLTAEKPKKGK